MNTRTLGLRLLSVLSGLLLTAPAQAVMVTFDFEASTGVNSASGSFTFDTATVDSNASATIGTYTDAISSYSGSANIAGLGTFNFGAATGDIEIRDGAPQGLLNYRDRFQARSGGGDGVFDDLTTGTLLSIAVDMDAIQATDPPFIDSTDLPLVPPAIFGNRVLRLVIEDADENSTTYTMTLTSLTRSVPEPATVALLGLGLASLGFSRRRPR